MCTSLCFASHNVSQMRLYSILHTRLYVPVDFILLHMVVFFLPSFLNFSLNWFSSEKKCVILSFTLPKIDENTGRGGGGGVERYFKSGGVACVIHFLNLLQWRHNELEASQTTSITIVYSTVYSRRRSKKASKLRASLAFVRGIHRSPVNSPHKGQVTRKMFPFDDVIMSFVNNYCW